MYHMVCSVRPGVCRIGSVIFHNYFFIPLTLKVTVVYSSHCFSMKVHRRRITTQKFLSTANMNGLNMNSPCCCPGSLCSAAICIVTCLLIKFHVVIFLSSRVG